MRVRTYPDVVEFDGMAQQLIATNRLGPEEYGASAIVAEKVLPSFGRRVIRALAKEQPDSLPRSVPPDPRCDIVRNGDQFVCRVHHRYWATGICPGVQ